jgi:hypothetical protein
MRFDAVVVKRHQRRKGAARGTARSRLRSVGARRAARRVVDDARARLAP